MLENSVEKELKIFVLWRYSPFRT